MKTYHLLVCLLLKIAAMGRADFLFEFEIVRHRTNGNCFGIDFTIPCETFVNDFCLRGPSFRGGTPNYNRNTCPLGKNSERVFETVPAQRTIQSTEPWPVGVSLSTSVVLSECCPFFQCSVFLCSHLYSSDVKCQYLVHYVHVYLINSFLAGFIPTLHGCP